MRVGQRLHARSRLGVPQPDALVHGAGDDRAVAQHAHRRDVERVSLELRDGAGLACAVAPEDDRLVPPAGHESAGGEARCSVRGHARERGYERGVPDAHRGGGVAVVSDRLAPHADGPVSRARRERVGRHHGDASHVILVPAALRAQRVRGGRAHREAGGALETRRVRVPTEPRCVGVGGRAARDGRRTNESQISRAMSFRFELQRGCLQSRKILREKPPWPGGFARSCDRPLANASRTTPATHERCGTEIRSASPA